MRHFPGFSNLLESFHIGWLWDEALDKVEAFGFDSKFLTWIIRCLAETSIWKMINTFDS